MERALRGTAGFVILLSLIFFYYLGKGWLFLTALVGLSLLQSAFTNWCPMMWIFKKLGMK